MPKYWGKQIFAHGSFPKVGEKQKTEREKKKREREERTMVITMAKLCMAHTSTHSARKPPGPPLVPGVLLCIQTNLQIEICRDIYLQRNFERNLQ